MPHEGELFNLDFRAPAHVEHALALLCSPTTQWKDHARIAADCATARREAHERVIAAERET